MCLNNVINHPSGNGKNSTYKHGEIGDGLLFYQHSLKIVRWGLDVGEKCRVYHCLLHFLQVWMVDTNVDTQHFWCVSSTPSNWGHGIWQCLKKLARCPQNGEMK
jgi:hypothetical protein